MWSVVILQLILAAARGHHIVQGSFLLFTWCLATSSDAGAVEHIKVKHVERFSQHVIVQTRELGA